MMAIAEIHAQAGRPQMSLAAMQKAIALAEDSGDWRLAEKLRHRLAIYWAQEEIEPGRNHHPTEPPSPEKGSSF